MPPDTAFVTTPAPSGDAADGLPATLHECETHTAEVCGTWTRVGRDYHAQWEDGSEAVIRVVSVDGRTVAFHREDHSGKSLGMRADYSAELHDGRAATGTVTWHADGLTMSGRWNAEW